MNQITREQAFDLAKYRYKLVDKEGELWQVNGVVENKLHIGNSKNLLLHTIICNYNIGKDYFILCIDLSQLTEIKNEYWMEFGGGVSEVAKDNWLNSEFENIRYTPYTSYPLVLAYFFHKLHFNLGFPQETVKTL